MTHEENFKEEAEKIVKECSLGKGMTHSGGIVCDACLAHALSEAYSKGREDEKKRFGSVYARMKQAENEGWNEAITAAVKVAEEYDNYDTYPFCNCPSVIASKIEALRKG